MLQKCRKHEMYVDPTVTPMGPRSLHFRGNCPIPRLQKLASSCARPAAALRDLVEHVPNRPILGDLEVECDFNRNDNGEQVYRIET